MMSDDALCHENKMTDDIEEARRHERNLKLIRSYGGVSMSSHLMTATMPRGSSRNFNRTGSRVVDRCLEGAKCFINVSTKHIKF